MGKAVIFTNGDLRDVSTLKSLISPESFFIAADGGWVHAQHLGIQPHVLIGDFDSMPKKKLAVLRESAVQLMRFPQAKDQTDLELALHEAVGRGYRDILIVAGLGGRVDQTIGNLMLLTHPAFRDCQIHLDDGVEEIWLVKSTLTIHGQVGDRVSLIAFGLDAEGITTRGLKYPLTNETLFPYQTRGISNLMASDVARIDLQHGRLLCIHTRKRRGKQIKSNNISQSEV